MPTDIWGQLGAFLLFRFFDAIKPGPIKTIDRYFKAWQPNVERLDQPKKIPSWVVRGFGVMIDDIAAASTNNWEWEANGLLMDVTGADSGLVWRLYTNGSRDSGREVFALVSDVSDVMTYYTYEYPNTTTPVYSYKNVMAGNVYLDASANKAHGAVLISDMSGGVALQDPSGSSAGYLVYGNAGLALIANSADLSGAVAKITEYAVLPITINDKKLVADNTSGTYLKLQDGAMYSDEALVLYNEAKFQEVMDREDIVEFSTMDAHNRWATPILRKALTLTPMERIFVPDASGNNQGSAKVFRYDNIKVGSTTYQVEKVLERDVLRSNDNAQYWTLDMLTTLGEEGATTIVNKNLTVTNKNGDTILFKNRTWLRPIDILNA
jgi:hypothetical protein